MLPRSARFRMRQWYARVKRSRTNPVWPILPGSERKPEGWGGWPENKQFAIALSHDIEGPAGVSRVRQLMHLELDLGFQSSFLFVPEGDYDVSPDLREELRRNGMEVGVHDLHHDGKLYFDRSDFRRKARKINHYLKDWNAVGFRSGFMLHNLDWLGDIDMLYDASTFDTDPFEPQPDGVHTIFPFWVENDRGGGFVELPYTLPQDSTLFLFLREKNIDLWKRKLDWIAEHGGLAFLDVHPDYMCFDERNPSKWEYSAALYREFLQFVETEYSGAYWHALPRDVALWVQKNENETQTSLISK